MYSAKALLTHGIWIRSLSSRLVPCGTIPVPFSLSANRSANWSFV